MDEYVSQMKCFKSRIGGVSARKWLCHNFIIFRKTQKRKMCKISIFFAHLSRRPSYVVRPSSTMLKHLLLRNRSADQSQILCGASLDRGD